MTLDAAVVDLSKSFESGQSYVALSRVKDLSWLSLLGFKSSQLSAHPLVLRGDTYFREQSSSIADEYTDADADALVDLYAQFVQRCGGTLVRDTDAVNRTWPKQLASTKRRKNTYAATAELITQWLSLDEIIKRRWLTKTTVIGHVVKIKADYPTISLDWLKPSASLLHRITEISQELIQDKSNLNDYGQLSLRALHQWLNGAVWYDEIKLCLLFLS
jgi:uncharacterized protein YpbB